MAATLAELQEFRAALVAARSTGIRSVRDSTGEEVTYRSDAEMAAAIRFMESEIARATGSNSRPRVIPLTYSKGLD